MITKFRDFLKESNMYNDGSTYFVQWSSFFDKNPYNIEAISAALQKIGATNIHVENQFGWSNQPEIVCFDIDENRVREAEDAVSAAVGTEWIIIREKDWKSKPSAVRENHGSETFSIELWNSPVSVKRLGSSKFELENVFGMEGVDSLKRTNGYGEAAGDFYDSFSVDVNDDTIVVTIFPTFLQEDFEGDEQEALLDVVKTISSYYDSVGWEFLQDRKN